MFLENIRLFSVTHKQVDFIPDGREFIGVGKNKEIKGVYNYDNTGDNISNKNANYCELTALYWIWKNINEVEYVGLEHYRRYISTKTCLFRPKALKINKIKIILKNYDIILPSRLKFKTSLYEDYKKNHYISDLDECKNIIGEIYPEYLDSFDKVIKNNKCSMFNIFIMKKELVNKYSEWLFNILFECEKRISIEDRSDYQKRVFGFLSERLFNVWLDKQNLKTYYAKVYLDTDKPWLIKIKKVIKFILRMK